MKPMPTKWETVVVDLPKTDYEEIRKEITLLVKDNFNKRRELMKVAFGDELEDLRGALARIDSWENKYLKYVEQLDIEKELMK